MFGFQVRDGTTYSTSSYSFTIGLIPVLVEDANSALPATVLPADPVAAVPPSTATISGLAAPGAIQPAGSPVENSSAPDTSASSAENLTNFDAGVPTARQDAGQTSVADGASAESVPARNAASRHDGFVIRTVLFDSEPSGISFAVPAGTLSDSGTGFGGSQDPSFLRELDRLRDSIRSEAELEQRVVGSAVAIGTGLSVGYVIWLLRGGLLLTSLLSSVPAWRFVDPLPVLGRLRGDDDDDEDYESLESIVSSAADHEREDQYGNG
jgi:hypothetical protein